MLMNVWRCQPLLLVLACLLAQVFWRSEARAQDEPPVAADPPATAVAAEEKPAAPAATPPAAEDWLRKYVYVPFKVLRQSLDNPQAGAFVPLDVLRTIEEQLRQKGWRPPDAPPANGWLTSSKYVGRAEGDVALFRVELELQVLKDAWVEIPLRFGDAAIGSVACETADVLLRGTGQGTYGLMLKQAGQHRVTLELTARVQTSPEGRRIELAIPATAKTEFGLSVNAPDQTFELRPQLLPQKVEGEPERSAVLAQLGATEQVVVSWKPRAGTRPDMELLANATAAVAVSVEDGLLHHNAFITVDVLRGQVETLQFAIPKGWRILDVSIEGKLKEWSVAAEETRQLLTVQLLSRTGGKLLVEIHTEAPLEGETIDVVGLKDGVHGIHAVGLLREQGQLSVRSGADLSLTVQQQQGLTRIEDGEADGRIRRAGATYYRYFSPDVRLALTPRPMAPRLSAQVTQRVHLAEERLRFETNAAMSIERAGVFELQYRLPEAFVVEKVECELLRQFDVSADGRTLTVVLREKRMGPLGVSIQGSMPWSPQSATDFLVPVIDPQGLEQESGTIFLLAPDALDVVVQTERLAGLQPVSDTAVATVPGWRMASAWSYERRPIALPIRTSRRPTRVTGTLATVLDVKPTQVLVSTTAHMNVQFAGLDTFRFSVPQEVADRVHVETADGSTPAIKQASRAAEVVDGFVVWTVVLQREQLGVVTLRLSYDLPLTGDATEQALTIPLARALDPKPAGTGGVAVTLTSLDGEVAVLKDKTLAVSAEAAGDDDGSIEPIDVRELTRLPHNGIAAFRYYVQPATITLRSGKFETQEVLQTIVPRALVEVVLDRAGAGAYRARYRVRSSERQRLRIDLPTDIELLGVTVDQKPVGLEKAPLSDAAVGWEPYFLNVARTRSSDEEFVISLVFRKTFSPTPFGQRGGDVLIRLPQIGGAARTGTAVQQQRVAVWSPREYRLVGTPKAFDVETEPRFPGWLLGRGAVIGGDELNQWFGHAATGVFDFPTDGHGVLYSALGAQNEITVRWWHRPFFTWLLSGTVALMALVLRRTSWENKFSVVILGVLAAAVGRVMDPDLTRHVIAASVWGLLAMAALWVVHEVLTAVRRPKADGAPYVTPPAVIPPPGAFDSVTLGLRKE